MQAVHDLVNYLNSHPEDLVALAALVSVLVQYLINHVKALPKLTNAVLGLVALPGLVTAVVALSTSLHATSYPAVVVAAQLLYHIYENIKRSAQPSLAAQVASEPVIVPVAAPLETPEY